MRNIKALLATSALGAVLLTGCSLGDFGDINKNPNRPSEAQTDMFFTYACTYTYNFTLNSYYYNPWTQMFNGYVAERNTLQYGKMNILEFDTSSYYLYPLKNLKYIIDLNSDDATKNTVAVTRFGSNKNQIATAVTLQAYFYMHLADILGPIPVKEALQAGEDNYTPTFDSVEDIYSYLDEKLKEAYALFDESGSLSSADIIFGGDVSKWKKLNASLRMLMAIKLSDVAESVGKSRFAAAYADGGIVDDGDSMIYRFDSNSPAPLYTNGVNYNSNFCPNEYIVEALKDYGDPRLFCYFSLVPFGGSAPVGDASDPAAYVGMKLGIPNVSDYAEKVCYFSESLSAAEGLLPIITAARVNLVAAEAAERGWISADAKSLYEAGVKASFEQWGAKDVDVYLASDKVAYAGTKAQKLEKIAMQRWLSGYMADGVEAWSDTRRLHVPAIEVGPAAVGITHIPYRMKYSGAISASNKKNYESAVSAAFAGTNDAEHRIWWDVK